MTNAQEQNKHGQNTDFRIDTRGVWYHDGTPIKREALAKLFSDRALKIDEDGNYWLQTPYEKYAVKVEDVPYIAVDYELRDGIMHLTTNMDEEIALTKDAVWELRNDIPYIEIRDGLFAKLARSVFYNVIEECGEHFESDGRLFALGEKDG